jgi:hypothetical protein
MRILGPWGTASVKLGIATGNTFPSNTPWQRGDLVFGEYFDVPRLIFGKET